MSKASTDTRIWNALHLDRSPSPWRRDTALARRRALAIRRFVRMHQCNPLHAMILEQREIAELQGLAVPTARLSD